MSPAFASIYFSLKSDREKGEKKLEKGKIEEIRALSVDFLTVRCPSAMNYVDAGSFDIEFYLGDDRYQNVKRHRRVPLTSS